MERKAKERLTKPSAPNSQDGKTVFPDHMRPEMAAQYIGLSKSKLAKLRMAAKRGEGPVYAKLGGSVIYRKADLDEWLHANLTGGFQANTQAGRGCSK